MESHFSGAMSAWIYEDEYFFSRGEYPVQQARHFHFFLPTKLFEFQTAIWSREKVNKGT